MYVKIQIHSGGVSSPTTQIMHGGLSISSHSVAPEVRSGAQESHKGDYHLLYSK